MTDPKDRPLTLTTDMARDSNAGAAMTDPKDRPLPLTADMALDGNAGAAQLGRIEPARVPADEAIDGSPPGAAGDRRQRAPVARGPGRDGDAAQVPATSGGAPGGSDPADHWGAGGFIRTGLFVLLVLVGGLGTWSALASLSGAVIASGQLRVESRRQVVQHLDGGTVGEILVRDGDVVEEGDTLLRLDGSQLQAELGVLESQLYEIMARRGRLIAEQLGLDDVAFDPELLRIAGEREDVARLVEGQRALFAAREETMERERGMLSERQTQIAEQIVGAEAQLQSVRDQREIVASELVDARTLLDRGLIQRPRVLALEREAASLLGDEGNLTAQIAQLRGQIAELEIELLRLGSTKREEAVTQLRDIEVRELELRERRIALLDRLGRLEIRAPRAGVVQEMTINTIGAVVRAAEPILHVVPTDTLLVVDARFEITARDQVQGGQITTLRFSAFNQRNTPELFGTVQNVSLDAIRDEATGEQYYLAEVRISEEELEKLGDRELVAGMPVEVYIQTGERSPFSYLLKPFTDYFNRAFREE